MAAGRGQLSSLDLLPDWAEEAKLWAFGELKARKRTQIDILEEFNARLRAAGLTNGVMSPPQISLQAFNRKAMRLAVIGRRLEETREIAAVLAPKLEAAGDDSVTLLVAESIKVLLNELIENSGDMAADSETAKMLMSASRALKHAEEAKRISSDTRQKLEAEFQRKAAKAVDAVAESKGLSAETVEQIKAKILGISRKAGDAA